MREEKGPPPWFRWQDGDLLLSLRVQPRARKDEVAGPAGDHLRVRITAPPVDGKANTHLRRFLAGVFGVPLARVEILSGQQGRLKHLRIRAPRRMPAFLGPDGDGAAHPPDTARVH